MPELKGNICSLRKVTHSDRDIITRWENNPEFWPVTETPGPFTTDDIKAFIESCRDLQKDGQERWMILSDSGRILGCLDLFEYNSSAQKAGIGILIAEKSDRNQGIATDALITVIRHLRDQKLLKVLSCLIFPENTPSIRLFRGVGFEAVSEVEFKGRKTISFELRL
ncbi:MAG: hypothetical protein RL220_958 [Bacteroidota bacterium]